MWPQLVGDSTQAHKACNIAYFAIAGVIHQNPLFPTNQERDQSLWSWREIHDEVGGYLLDHLLCPYENGEKKRRGMADIG